MQNPIQKFTFI